MFKEHKSCNTQSGPAIRRSLRPLWPPVLFIKLGIPYVCSAPCRRRGWPCPCDTPPPVGDRHSGRWRHQSRTLACWQPGVVDSAERTWRSVDSDSGREGNVFRPDIESCRRILREWGRAHAVTRAHCLLPHKTCHFASCSSNNIHYFHVKGTACNVCCLNSTLIPALTRPLTNCTTSSSGGTTRSYTWWRGKLTFKVDFN